MISQLLALRQTRVERAQQTLAGARARHGAAARARDDANDTLAAWTQEAASRENAIHASIFHQIVTQRRMEEVRGVVAKLRARTVALDQARAAAQQAVDQAADAVDTAQAARARAQREAEKVQALNDVIAQERRGAQLRREDEELDEVVCLTWRQPS